MPRKQKYLKKLVQSNSKSQSNRRKSIQEITRRRDAVETTINTAVLTSYAWKRISHESEDEGVAETVNFHSLKKNNFWKEESF